MSTLLRTKRLLPTRWSGVYRAPGSPMTAELRQWAVVLGARAVLSHVSAAALWQIEVPQDGLIHIISPRRRGIVEQEGVKVHRVHLAGKRITAHAGMPVTTREQTVLDCLRWLPFRDAVTLLDRALQQKWTSISSIDQQLTTDEPKRWGNKQLARLLEGVRSGARAESERRLIALLGRARIVGWCANYSVSLPAGRFVLDFAFRESNVAIEVDGWTYHKDAPRFQADRVKQNALVAAGWIVLRFTWWDLTEDPGRVVKTIRTVLDGRES